MAHQPRHALHPPAAGLTGFVGENIHYGGLTAEDAVKSRLSSLEHCRNLMDPQWTHVGLALHIGTVKTVFPTYWVQVFGRPK